MTTKVIMPRLGESVVEGTVTKWLKREGEQVEEFEPLLEINTDKVDTEVPSPAAGTLLKVYVGEGQTVQAGTLLAVIGEPGEEIPEAPEVAGATMPVSAPAAVEATPVSSVAPSPPRPGRQADLGFISPVVARIAAEHKVDLTQVRGTGRGGRITKKDMLAYLESRPAGPAPAAPAWEQPGSGELFRPSEEVFGGARPPASQPEAEARALPGTVQPLDVVRRSIAEHMVRSKRISPHVSTIMEADMSRVMAHRRNHKEDFAHEGINLTYTPYFVAAAAEALRAVPMANSSWSDEGIVLHGAVNVGVAVSLGERGLIVPVIKEADQMSLRGLARAVQDLSTRARSGQLSPAEVQGGTFTITNHGVGGSLFATPIINQPQCAILGVGKIQKRVVVIESSEGDGGTQDLIAIRPMVYLTLTFDHRILDGAVADQFLGLVVMRLESWA